MATEATSDEASETVGSSKQPLASPGVDTGATDARQFCGGIAAIPCPGAGRCVDDPTDNCDPSKGGADCGGICSCIETVLCIRGSHFDTDPGVCSCVPDQPACIDNVLCIRGSHFDSDPDVCACVPDQPACIDNVLCIRGSHFDSDPDVCACVPDQDPCVALSCQAGTICVAKDGEAACVPRRHPHHHHHHRH